MNLSDEQIVEIAEVAGDLITILSDLREMQEAGNTHVSLPTAFVEAMQHLREKELQFDSFMEEHKPE